MNVITEITAKISGFIHQKVCVQIYYLTLIPFIILLEKVFNRESFFDNLKN